MSWLVGWLDGDGGSALANLIQIVDGFATAGIWLTLHLHLIRKDQP